MCHRISPLLIEELKAAVEGLRATGHARVPQRDPAQVVPDAYPGKQLPLFTIDAAGELVPTVLTWGFIAPQGAGTRLVFNTRIETALSQARSGRGMWAEAITRGRCLVPVRGFYERLSVSTSEDATKLPRGTQVRFTLPGHRHFLLAGIWQDDRFSVVTTAPNDTVARVHTRMPLVLGPGESSVWLGPDFARLADRSSIILDATPEQAASLASADNQGLSMR